MPDASESVLQPMTDVFSLSMPRVRELIPVRKQRKVADLVILKFVRLAVQRTDNIGVFKHGELETFRVGTQDGVVDAHKL